MEIGNKERNLVIHQIYNEILETYPFLTSEERLAYEEKAGEILGNATFADPLEEVNKLLELLRNPHANTWPVKEGKGRKPSQKPTLRIEDGILYIKIPTWNKRLEGIAEKLINFCRENKNKYQAVIVDVRGNHGGNSYIAHKFAGIFFERDVPFGRFIKRVKGQGLQEEEAVMSANGEVYIDKPLAILISNKCFSSNELFLAPF